MAFTRYAKLITPFAFALLVFPRYSLSQVNTVNTNLPSIVDSDAIQLPIDLLQLRPNSVSGPRFDLELPDGLSCSSINGTPPSLNFYGGSTRRDNRYQAFPDFVSGGHSVGAVLSVPLSRIKATQCDEAYKLYLATKKIELIEGLYDTGVLSEKHVQDFAIKSLQQLGFDLKDASALFDSSNGSTDVEQLDAANVPEPYIVGP